MPESRYRSGRKKGFVVLMRSAAQDDRLSLETRGLFALMVSLPENWDYSVSGLAKKAGCGKDKIRRLLKELETVGYLIREQSHANGGKFGENIYILQDEAPPLSGNTVNGENRQREKPSTEIPTQNNKDLKEEENKKPPISPKGDVGSEKKRPSKYELQEDAKPVLRQYCGEDEELARKLAKFINHRTVLKAINSKDGIIALLRKLDKLSGGNRNLKFELIDEAMANSWKSVFPIKGTAARQGISRTVEEEEGTYLL